MHQYFKDNIIVYNAGFVELPAGAIKDAEGVGESSQVFFVAECQDSSVELG